MKILIDLHIYLRRNAESAQTKKINEVSVREEIFYHSESVEISKESNKFAINIGGEKTRRKKLSVRISFPPCLFY